MKLVIGNKNYSSWSLRPWLLINAFEVPYEEICIPLFTGDWQQKLSQYTDAEKVPVLIDRDTEIWDSLSICEYICEQYLDGRAWPSDPLHRAQARSCSAEMHSSFFLVRESMPMNCRANKKFPSIPENLQHEINRLDQIWVTYRKKFQSFGDWLFGEFSIADCMFAPIALRFKTYNISVSEAGQSYLNQLLDHPTMKLWMALAREEKESIPVYDDYTP